MDHPVIANLLLLFGLTLVSGTIDAMAGGGGLLNVPALLMLGFDPASALATNKFQGIFSSLSASVHFWRKGRIRLKDHWRPVLAAFLAGVCGALAASFVDPEILRIFIPFLLIGIAVWMLVHRDLGEAERKARLSFMAFALTIVPLLGFYDGFFGPGVGTFFAIANVFFLGLRLEEATIRAKLYNVAANIGATLSFLFAGHIVWLYALVMTAGTLIGGNIGARLVIKYGTGMIKPVLVAMSIAMSVKLLWQQGLVQRAVGL